MIQQLSRVASPLTIDNWPMANRRGVAKFEVLRHHRGYYGVRELNGIRRITDVYPQIALVVDQDNKTYFVAITESDKTVLIPGTLKNAFHVKSGKIVETIRKVFD